ncbi:SPFH domain-containing protein [Dongia sp.]|uniref:SPFH domain-containing protein n=1 Tax=Dongia sp. TaxID=1977262 RepID=UPI0035B278FC
MFGVRFLKTQPTEYVIQFRNGMPIREGAGLSLFYFAPTSSFAVVPTASISEPFIFTEATADYQEVTVQGQVIYRIADPRRISSLLNFTLGSNGRYASEDPDKLSLRVIDQIQVAMRNELEKLTLQEALVGGISLVTSVSEALRNAPMLQALGLDVLTLSVLEIKPKPETAKALAAQAREDLLRRADEAIYARRNASVEQERGIKENELSTEVAVENKKRQIKETQIDAERSFMERQRLIKQEEIEGKIDIERRKKELVDLAAENSRQEADAKAYGIEVMMKAFATADAKVLQALASVGMQPGQMMAMAFRELADNSAKIGQLNISPDLLREMMTAKEI